MEQIAKIMSKWALMLFILFTAIAAFSHSSWVLSTAFGGTEPAYTNDLTGGMEHFKWSVGGWLIAFALDFGLMVVSHDLQDGNGSGSKVGAFGVLSFFTYILQLVYISIHYPKMEISQYIHSDIAGLAQLVINYSVYLFPAMLPVSTAIYTIAYRTKRVIIVDKEDPVIITETEPVLTKVAVEEPKQIPAEVKPKRKYTRKSVDPYSNNSKSIEIRNGE